MSRLREAARAMVTAWQDGEHVHKYFFRDLRDALAEDRLDEMQALTEGEYSAQLKNSKSLWRA